jgi:hypothetical protein
MFTRTCRVLTIIFPRQVYQVIAPLTSYILGFCFVIMRPVFLHQFVYIYPASPDSGGVIWADFIKILLICMIIAELTILGFLALKKSEIGSALMVRKYLKLLCDGFPVTCPAPAHNSFVLLELAALIVVTMLFNAYIREEHFRVANVLPTEISSSRDLKNREDFNLDFVRGAYLQEELRHKDAFAEDLPESLDLDRAEILGITPPRDEGEAEADEPKEEQRSFFSRLFLG